MVEDAGGAAHEDYSHNVTASVQNSHKPVSSCTNVPVMFYAFLENLDMQENV